MSGLAEFINNGGYTTTLALEDNFFDRNDGWLALLDHYGFDSEAVQNWEGNIEVLDVGLAYEKLRFEEADVGLGYTTNPKIREYNLEVIEDDRNF
jgi:glycine betaine/choline ABC-type transport system substrate-binding protein